MGSVDGWHGLTRQQQIDLLAWWRVRNTKERTVTAEEPGDGSVQDALRQWRERFTHGD